MFRNPGKHLSIHLMNFYNSQLSGCKHCKLLPANGKGPVFLSASPRLRLFCCLQRCFCFFFLWLGPRGALFIPGDVTKKPGKAPAGRCRVEAAWGGHARPARPCANPPARRGDLCPFVSCDTQPVFVLKFIHDGYASLPIAYAGSPAERTDKLFSAAGLAGLGWGRRAAEPGGEGPAGAGPLRAPARRPAGRGAASRSPRNMKGDDSRPLRSFLNAKECRKLPDQLVNQWQLQ